jgi:hypothetical protein
VEARKQARRRKRQAEGDLQRQQQTEEEAMAKNAEDEEMGRGEKLTQDVVPPPYEQRTPQQQKQLREQRVRERNEERVRQHRAAVALTGFKPDASGRVGIPGCQSGYMDHIGCHQLVF